MTAPPGELTIPLRRLRRLLRGGRLSSVDLVEAYQARIAADRNANAVVECNRPDALRSAANADRHLRAGDTSASALCGIPLTVKRTFTVGGYAHGPEDLDPGMPDSDGSDAKPVRILREQHAVILGRTNAPPLAADIDTVHPRFGRTPHPCDPAHSPGGSSGGSAAAVRLGHTSFDLASDVAGSARIPASLCGLFALRPGPGRVSAVGHVPGPSIANDHGEMLAVSPITRYADDLRVVWHALTGLAQVSDGRSTGRIGVVITGAPIEPHVTAALTTAVEHARMSGLDVVEVELPVDLAVNWALCQKLLYAEDAEDGSVNSPQGLCISDEPGADAHPMEIALWSAGMSHRDWLRCHRQRVEIQLCWQRFFAEYSALILPILGVSALEPRDTRVPLVADQTTVAGIEVPLFSLSTWCALASVGGLPAVAMPARSGFPSVGLQVLAGPGQESRLLDLVVRLAIVLCPGQSGVEDR